MSRRVVRLAFAGVLLAFLCYYSGVRELLGVLRNVTIPYILSLLALSVVLIWISCVKWRLFVRAAGYEQSVGKLMQFYTMSYFFNLFLPSILGGDVARSVQLGSKIGNYADAFAATFVERFTGFLAMNVVGVFFVMIGAKATSGVDAAILSVAFLTASAGLVLFSEKRSLQLARLTTRLLRAIGLHQFSAKLEKFTRMAIDGMAFARKNDRLFTMAMLYSLAFHFLAAVNTYVAARCIGWYDADFGSICIVVPLVLLVSVAPVTPSAVGVQEGAFLFFLTRIGATHAQGLAVGLVLRAKNIVTALAGGLIWVLVRDKSKNQLMPQAGLGESDKFVQNA